MLFNKLFYFNIQLISTTNLTVNNPFASECFFGGKINEQFHAENTPNLTHEFCMTILTRKFYKFF